MVSALKPPHTPSIPAPSRAMRTGTRRKQNASTSTASTGPPRTAPRSRAGTLRRPPPPGCPQLGQAAAAVEIGFPQAGQEVIAIVYTPEVAACRVGQAGGAVGPARCPPAPFAHAARSGKALLQLKLVLVRLNRPSNFLQLFAQAQ